MMRSELVAAARDTIRLGSKSFYMASQLFDRQTRERAWLLYCWCRYCDDVCDGQRLGQGACTAGLFAAVEERTQDVLEGRNTGELPFDALALVMEERAIPKRFVLDHLRGFQLDTEGWRPEREEDLIRYCYHVAGAVGCMMAIVMGVSPDDEETLERASDLGIAFQLSNIARDVREDHEAGRCYLPVELAREHGIDLSDPMRPGQFERVASAAKRLVTLAGAYERSARRGVAKLPFRSRWAVLAAARIYGAIGRQVAALGAAAWEQRVVVRRREKLAFLIPSFVESAWVRQRA